LNVSYQAFRLALEAIGLDAKKHVEKDEGHDKANTNAAQSPNQCGSMNHSVLDTEDEAISATSRKVGRSQPVDATPA
jgi:hypothetical protein